MIPFSSSLSISKFISSHPPLTILETNCTTMKDLHQLHSQIIKTGLANDPIAVSRLLSFCATSPSGNLRYAEALFSHSTPNPTAFMWNTLIRSFSKSSNPYLAISLFHQMLHSSTQPQTLTFPSLFTACAHINSAHHGAQLHAFVFKLGFHADPYISNSMLSMYATCGYLTEAYRLFNEEQRNKFDSVPYNAMILGLAKKGLIDESRCLFNEMPVRTLVTWSSMISGYVRNGKNIEALDLFRRMQDERIESNEQIMVSLLGACACLGALEQGEWIHGYIERKGFESNLIVKTAIIDMYCKCGNIDKGIAVFEQAGSIKGLSAWNAMISGLSIHGRGPEAVCMFTRLEASGLRPDSVSFVSILAACNHSGLVVEAQHYFAKMVQVYGIEPKMEHYGCLVDVLGRAGLIKESEELIRRMPMEPDAIIWGALLASSQKNYTSVEIAEQSLAQIAELDPSDSGGFVTLSNCYASGGNFSSAVKARGTMKKNGVHKAPGSSVIEVNREAHEFVAGGMLHPRAREICEVLDGLVWMMME